MVCVLKPVDTDVLYTLHALETVALGCSPVQLHTRMVTMSGRLSLAERTLRWRCGTFAGLAPSQPNQPPTCIVLNHRKCTQL